MEAIDGQLSFFNEADVIYDDTAAEPTAEEVLAPYSISEEELDAFYGKGNWKRMPDETPTQVLNDDRSPGSQSYMWVHRSGEFYKQCPIVIYEYQKGRDHRLPLEFYRDYKGILVTDGIMPMPSRNAGSRAVER